MSKKAGKKAKVKVPEIDPDSPEWMEEVARKQTEAYDMVQRAMTRSQVCHRSRITHVPCCHSHQTRARCGCEYFAVTSPESIFRHRKEPLHLLTKVGMTAPCCDIDESDGRILNNTVAITWPAIWRARWREAPFSILKEL